MIILYSVLSVSSVSQSCNNYTHSHETMNRFKFVNKQIENCQKEILNSLKHCIAPDLFLLRQIVMIGSDFYALVIQYRPTLV